MPPYGSDQKATHTCTAWPPVPVLFCSFGDNISKSYKAYSITSYFSFSFWSLWYTLFSFFFFSYPYGKTSLVWKFPVSANGWLQLQGTLVCQWSSWRRRCRCNFSVRWESPPNFSWSLTRLIEVLVLSNCKCRVRKRALQPCSTWQDPDQSQPPTAAREVFSLLWRAGMVGTAGSDFLAVNTEL